MPNPDPTTLQNPRKQRLLKLLLLQIAILTLTTACGGGSDDDAPPATPAPAPQVVEGRFVEDTISGLGFTVADVVEGRTDDAGTFRFAQGRRVDFFVGDGANRVVVGSATPTPAANGASSFALNDLTEVQAANGDEYLGNLVGFLTALDANSDITDGVQIDAASNTAVAQAVAGGKKLSFSQGATSFIADPVVVAVLDALKRNPIDIQTALAEFTLLFRQSRSGSIALTNDDKRVVVVNRQKDSVSVIRVRKDDGTDTDQLIAEVPVGDEPRFVALSPDDKRAYVTNALDGTLSTIDLSAEKPQPVGNALDVGVEPRGVAITPNGTYAFVANHTSGDVAVVRLSTMQVVNHVHTGGNPYAIAITNDGDRNDLDERVFVTRLFGEVIDPSRPDGFDDAKQGIVASFRVGEAVAGNQQVASLLLKPMASGFNADRRNFCLATRQTLQAAGTVFFNSGADKTGDGASQLAKTTFCPDVNSTDASADGPIGKVAQKVYPNMLFDALVRGSQIYVPNVGAQPEPPVRFNSNVQALVGVLDRVHGVESARSVNLNAQVVKEKQPAEGSPSLDRLFLNDMVAVDADRRGRNFLFVSRGGNYVVRAKVGADGKLTILDANNAAKRLQTGNLPSGVVMSRDGKRAYTNNELNTSVSALDLEHDAVLVQDIESSAPPAPGTVQHRRLVGKLAFFTALGLPDKLDENGDGAFDLPLRSINPVEHRGKASDNAWSSCGSCHDDGHSDNVTWIFETGPRNTIPLEGTFARNDLSDQRILNWSGVRGSNTDFNNNARGIQGGKGFASNVGGEDRSALVFNHGPTRGVSDSLDAMSEWVATVRAPIVPAIAADKDQAGRAVFTANCASCHGGKKWTKSRTRPLYADNPVFAEDTIGANFFLNIKAIDPGVANAGPQIVSVTRDGKGTLKLLDNVGTFNAASAIELRGAAAVAGQTTQGFAPFGAVGFNTPSLLGLSLSAPYLHDGSALTLDEVAARHQLAGGQTISQKLTASELANVLELLRSIDDDTTPIASDTDKFLE